MTFKQVGTFIVQYMLWHWVSSFAVSSKISLNYDRRGNVEVEH